MIIQKIRYKIKCTRSSLKSHGFGVVQPPPLRINNRNYSTKYKGASHMNKMTQLSCVLFTRAAILPVRI